MGHPFLPGSPPPSPTPPPPATACRDSPAGRSRTLLESTGRASSPVSRLPTAGALAGGGRSPQTAPGDTYDDHSADMAAAELRVGRVVHVGQPAACEDAQPHQEDILDPQAWEPALRGRGVKKHSILGAQTPPPRPQPRLLDPSSPSPAS